MTSDDILELVREFRTKFNCSKDVALAERLIREEIQEVKEAAAHLLKELIDLMYVVNNADLACDFDGIDKDVLIDAVRLISQYAAPFDNYAQESAVMRVHKSNMMKQANTTGDKIQKGPNYVEPNLMDLI